VAGQSFLNEANYEMWTEQLFFILALSSKSGSAHYAFEWDALVEKIDAASLFS
jgi:hypothetical protein